GNTFQQFIKLMTGLMITVMQILEVGLKMLQTKRDDNSFVATEALRITARLKEIKKRRALRGKQRVELLTNSEGKRIVVLLNPSFFYFFNPFFVIRNSFRSD